MFLYGGQYISFVSFVVGCDAVVVSLGNNIHYSLTGGRLVCSLSLAEMSFHDTGSVSE